MTSDYACRPVLRLSRRAMLAAAAASIAVGPARAATQISVVATTGMIADAARNVAGDRATVTALMGAGVDPHAYRQTRADIAAMTAADLTLWHGLYLEAQLEPFLLELGARRPVAAVGEGVARERLIADPEYADRFDPHVWLVPELWAEVVVAVRDALTGVDPTGAETYALNAERHVAELTALGAYAREALATVPEPARVLVTAHDAFNYFGRAYGFDVEGVQGISTESEAGLKRIEELATLIAERGVPAVFVETSVADRNLRALIEGAAARGRTVVIGGELFSDAMGEPGTYEGTYVGMIDHNATVIARALGGRAPERGMSGALAAA